MTSQVSYGQGTVEARLLLTSGQAQLYTRQSVSGDYLVTLNATGSAALYRGGQLVTAGQSAPSPDGWWNLAFTAAGNDLRLTVNGLPVLAALDVSPLPPGTITLLSSDGLLVEWLSVTEIMQPAAEVAGFAESLPSELPVLATATPNVYEEAATASANTSFSLQSASLPIVTRQISSVSALQAAVLEANNNHGNHYVLRLAPGTYDLIDTVALNSFLPVDGTVTIIGINSYVANTHPDNFTENVILQRADGAINNDVFHVVSSGTLTLYNVVVRNGGGEPRWGGGGFVVWGKLNIYNSVVADNLSGSVGGAIYVNPNAEVTLINTVFRNNGTSAYGGAILNTNGTVNGSCVTFENNQAYQGGAIYNGYDDGGNPTNATTVLNNVNFILNNVTSLSYRAIYNRSGASIIPGSVYWQPTVGSLFPIYITNDVIVSATTSPSPLPLSCPVPPAPILLPSTIVAFDPARFDAQLGAIRAQLDGLSGQLSEKTLKPFRENMFKECNKISEDLGKEREFCKIHASMLLILKFRQIATGSSDFDHQFLLEHLVFGEYGSYILGFPNHTYFSSSPVRQWVWPDEAIARQLNTACQTDGCQGDELYDFLEYFQHPLNGYFFMDHIYLGLLRDKASRPENTYFQDQLSAVLKSVEAILSPPPDSPSWLGGVIPNTQPYGYGTDLAVESGRLSQRVTCNPDGFAYKVQTNDNGTVNIFFGTILDSVNVESCKAQFPP